MATVLRSSPIEVTLPTWGVFVLESEHGPDFHAQTMRHPYLKIIYVLRGRGRLWLRGQATACAADDVIVVPIGQTHRLADEPSDPLALYVVCLDPSLWAADRAAARALPVGRVPAGPLLSGRVQTMLRRLLYEQTTARAGHRSMMQADALRLLVTLMRSAPAGPSGANDPQRARRGRAQVAGYVQRLHRRFFEAGSIDDAAAELGMSRRRFTQLFREITGDSWAAHVRQLRIDHATRLLSTTRRTVVAIAFECGFEDLSTFYRAFRRLVRCTPAQWRAGQR